MNGFNGLNGIEWLFSSFSNKDTSTQSLNLTSRCTSECYEQSSHGTVVLPCPARVLSFNIMIMCTLRRCTFCEACFSSGGLAQHCGASYTQHHSLSMAEHRGDLIATCRHRGQTRFSTEYPPKVSFYLYKQLQNKSHVQLISVTWTFDVHEVRVWALDQPLLLMPPPLLLRSWMQQVFRQLRNESYTEMRN